MERGEREDRETGASTSATGHAQSGGLELRCDFCGEVSTQVRRVALDRDYDRLRVPHRELYACPSCSERKERARLGIDREGRSGGGPLGG